MPPPSGPTSDRSNDASRPLDPPAPPKGPAGTGGDRGGTLMVAWRDGNAAAFDELVELYSGQVFALLTRFLGRTHPGREDMVQDVFLRVVRARDRYEPTAKFSTWLYSIVWRMCINETERGSARRAVSLDQPVGDADGSGRMRDPIDDDMPAPSSGIERGDLVRAVRSAIAELPEGQRIALVLARYHDMPYAEIADVVGSTEKAVKSSIHRARETLRDELRPLFESEVA